MNRYGIEAKKYWADYAPSRYEALEDPEAFFEGLGEQVEEQVLTLSLELQGNDPADEDYLEKVRRLTAAQRQAEEIVKSDLVWIKPELEGDELREEWDGARPQERGIVDNWAVPISNGYEPYKTAEEMADYWMMSVSFFEELAAAESHLKVMDEHEKELLAAKENRFTRWVKNGAVEGQE